MITTDCASLAAAMRVAVFVIGILVIGICFVLRVSARPGATYLVHIVGLRVCSSYIINKKPKSKRSGPGVSDLSDWRSSRRPLQGGFLRPPALREERSLHQEANGLNNL